MEQNRPRLPGGRKKTVPMLVRIVCAVILSAVLVGTGLFLLLRDHAKNMFRSANAASEYLTAEESSVFAEQPSPVPAPATPFPTSEPTATPDQNRISVSAYATLQLGDDY